MTDFDLSNVQVHFMRTSADAGPFLDWMRRQSALGLDVETSGLKAVRDELRLVQFGALTEAWAIPFERFPHTVLEGLRIINENKIPIVGHNFRFDLGFLYEKLGWTPDWSLVNDTLVSASLIDPVGFSKALKEQSVRWVSPMAATAQALLAEDMKKGGWTWATVPVDLPSYWVYGGVDTIINLHLLLKHMEEMKRLGLVRAYRETEMPCFPSLFWVERNGMLVDVEHCQRHIEAAGSRLREIETEVIPFGISNLGSSAQIGRAMNEAGIFSPLRSTKTGAQSWTAEVLDAIGAMSDHPLSRLVTEYRRLGKMSANYYQAFLNFREPDGRVHPQYNQLQARTHRMSATDPAVQTLPRPGTDPDVRNSFIAAPGRQFISTDFSNVEARLFAEVAKETGMIGAIMSGTDLHGWTAMQIFHLSEPAHKDDPRRQIAKNALFCTLYGGGPEKLALTAGIPVEDAAEVLDNGLFRAFPGIKVFQERMIREAKTNRYRDRNGLYIRLSDGRRIKLATGDDRVYAFANFAIQGEAGILMKERLRAIHAAGADRYLVGVVHDEVIAEVPDNELDDYRMLIRDLMEDDHRFSVPIVAEPGIAASRLGDAK